MLEMSMTTNAIVSRSLDRSLLDAAKHLASEERQATAALLRALMEIDSRRLYLGEGHASMFSYCTGVLHLAEGAAYNRIEAARAARMYPVIFELFEQSAITLTAVRLLAPHLTAANHAVVLASAKHESTREIEELAAGAASRVAARWWTLRVRGVGRAMPRDRVSRVPPCAATCRWRGGDRGEYGAAVPRAYCL
jgi:hypothetical protein